MAKNHKVKVSRMRTGIASATLAAAVLSTHPMLVQADNTDHTSENELVEEVALTESANIDEHQVETQSATEEDSSVDKLSNLEVVSYQLDKTEIRQGELVKLTIELASERNIEQVSFQFQPKDGPNQWAESVVFSEFTINEAGNYVGETFFQDFSSMGDYEARNSSVVYKNGLTGYLDFKGSPISITITNADVKQSVNLLDLEVVGKDTYTLGDTIHLKATFDNVRGMNSAEVYFSDGKNLDYDISVRLSDFEKNSDGTYTGYGDIDIHGGHVDGTYAITNAESLSNLNINFNMVQDLHSKELFTLVDTGRSGIESIELVDFKFDKNAYNRGEKVNVQIILDSPEPLKAVHGLLTSSDWNFQQWLDIYDIHVNSQGHYVAEGSITVSDKDKIIADGQTFTITNVAASDSSYNTVSVENNLDKVPSFTVHGEPDIKSPVIIGVKLDKETYRPGDTINYEFRAQDVSGISYFTVTFDDENLGDFRELKLEADDFEQTESGEYVARGEYKLSNFMENKRYEMISLRALDLNDNETEMNHEQLKLAGMNRIFEITDSKVSNREPKIVDFFFDKSVYAAGEKAELTIIFDTETSVDEAALYFTTDDNKGFNVIVDKFTKDSNGHYVGKKIFIPGGYDGEFYPNLIRVHEPFSPETYIQDLKVPMIKILETQDVRGPMIERIEIPKAEYLSGELIEFKVILSDESQVDRVDLHYKLEGEYHYTNNWVSINEFIRDENGHYVGMGSMRLKHDYSDPKTFILSYAQTFDVMDNREMIYDLSIADKVVIKPNTLTERPEMVSIETGKEIYYPGDHFEFSVIANSEKGVDVVRIDFLPIDYLDNPIALEAFYYVTDFKETAIPGQYSGYFEEEIASYMFFEDNKYIFWGVEVYDNYHNSTRYGYGEPGEYSFMDVEYDLKFYRPESTPDTDPTDPDDVAEIVEITETNTGVTVVVEGYEEPVKFVAKDVSETVENIPAVLGSNFALYDFYLTDMDENYLELNGTATIRVPFDSKLKPVSVYHFGDNFEVTNKLNFTIENGHIVFTTDDFSYFGIEFALADADTDGIEDVEEEVTPEDPTLENPTSEDPITNDGTGETGDSTTPSDSDSSVEETATETKKSNELPPTGEASIAFTQVLGLLFTTIGTALGFKKKNN